MTDAEVLQQVRDARDAYAHSHGYDIDAISADLRAKAAAGGRQVVRLPPRRPTGLSPEQREALSMLAEVWALSPEVRFGQLMAHLDLLGDAHVGKRLGSIENEEFVAVLEHHLDELKARQEGREKPPPELAGNAPSVSQYASEK